MFRNAHLRRLVAASFFVVGVFSSSVAQCTADDLELLCNEGEAINGVVFDCGFSCFLSNDITACFQDCIQSGVPAMSYGCVTCFAEQSTCVTNSCFFACAFGSEADCEACVQTNCQAGFETCAGIVDGDADGESNVCDCDDNDASAYPGALGTAEGVDNDCDGLIGEDEALPVIGCPSDLNADLTVSIADLLLLLSEFGCIEGCSADINGDGQVAVSDVLELLSSFGEPC
jgi:hypothetical protein